MKGILITLILMSTVIGGSFAQETKYYWVVETNIYNPNYTIVRFYDKENVKVYEVKLMGVYIDIQNPKHRKRLDQLMREFNDRVAASNKKNPYPLSAIR